MVRAALVLAGVAAAAVLAQTDAPERQRVPRANPLLVRRTVGENLEGLTAGGGDVWVNDFGRERLLRIDGRSGRVVARFALGRRIALAADRRRGVWALRWGGRFLRTPNGPLYRIDPATNRITARVALDPDEIYFGVLSDGRDVWVWGPRNVVHIEPSTGFLASQFRIRDDSSELTGAVLHDGVLLATTTDGRLLHIGRGGLRRSHAMPELARAELLAVDRGNALAAVAGALVAIDARTGRPRWRRPLGFRISTMLPRDGILLVHGAAFHDAGDRLWAIDTATGRVLASTLVPSFGTTGMLAAGGALWFATAAGEVIVVPPLLVRLFVARAKSGRH